MNYELRGYQEEAIERMIDKPYFLEGDPMGSGKTVIALFEIKRQLEKGMILVVTIKTAIPQWKAHIHSIFDDVEDAKLQVNMGRGKGNECIWGLSSGALNFVVINWEALLRHERYWDDEKGKERSRYVPGGPIYRIKWDRVIADESQYANNRKAQRTKGLKKLVTASKRPMTGTMFINHPHELWSILNWMDKKEYSSYWRFFDKYVDYVKHNKGECEECGDWHQKEYREILGVKNKGQLKREIGTFAIRRAKKTIMPELPEKFYTRLDIELGPEQRRIYKEMKEKALAWVGERGDQPLPAPIAIAQLTRLRQIACATPHVEFDDEEGKLNVDLIEPSSKLDALFDVIEGTDEQIVVFSQFTKLIRLAEKRFDKLGISYSRIIGADSVAAREKAIESFKTGESRIFIGQTKAAGAALDGLQVASIAVFLDRMWSPASNWQAEDRLHRHGQKNAVQIINIIATSTIDEKVDSTVELKASWFVDILGM